MSDHSGFIFAAFALSAVIIAIMIGAIVWDYRNVRRALSRFPDRDSPTKDQE